MLELRLKCDQDIFVGLGLSTSAGRASGTNKFEDFECPAAKKAPLGHDHLLTKLDDLRNDLKRANEEISKLLGTVKEQEQVIKEKAQFEELHMIEKKQNYI